MNPRLTHSLRRFAGPACLSVLVLCCGSWASQVSAARTMIGQTMPINIAVPSGQIRGGSDSIAVSVEVDRVPASGGIIQIGTDTPSTVASPSGTWPYQHWIAPGSSTTVSLNLSTSSVSSQTQVKIYACEAGVDCSNPANWAVQGTVTVVP